MLQLQQQVLNVNMNPNKPYYLGQNHRYKALQAQEIKPRSYSLQLNNSRLSQHSNNEVDLRNSLIGQSNLQYQEKLQKLMNIQNELLRQKLLEIENKQLKIQNEMLQKHVQEMEGEFENTMKVLHKQKLPQISAVVQTSGLGSNIIRNSQSRQSKQYKELNKQKTMNDQIDKQYHDDINMDGEKLYNGSQSFQISDEFEYKTQKKSVPAIPNIKQKYHQLKKESKKQLKGKLKKYFLAIHAYIRISKNYRLKRQEQSKKLKNIRTRFANARDKVLSFPENEVKQLLWEWVQDLLGEFIQELNRIQFINHYEASDYDPNSDENILFRQKMIIKLTQDFFTLLEKMSRMDALPTIITNLLFLSLFQSQNPKVALFIAKRTNFYMKNSIKIANLQEKLIIGEYLFFRLIIPYMLKVFNNLKYRNLMHEKQCKFFGTILASLIQIIYMDYFEDLKLVKNINVELYQRKIIIDDDRKALMIENESIDENEIIIIGLFDKSAFGNLLELEVSWISSIGNLFHQILSNLHNQI